MQKKFGGPAIFLDRSDINTDEIIPAKYLTEVTKEALTPYILEDLKLAGFDPKGDELRNAKVVVSRENFGCGSSREHAPWVFEVNDVHTIIAESYARIFRQNMFNCGMLAIELPKGGYRPVDGPAAARQGRDCGRSGRAAAHRPGRQRRAAVCFRDQSVRQGAG